MLMFALRGIAISLTFFVLLYCLLSALVTMAWRLLRLLQATEQSLAALLFALRVLPLAASVVITLALVVPSFQLLEPRSIAEGTGAMPITLSVCALLLIACGCFRVITAQTKTARVVARGGRRALSECGCWGAKGDITVGTRGPATHAGGCAAAESADFRIHGCAFESRRTAHRAQA